MTSRRARNKSTEHLLRSGLPADSALSRLLADASAPAQTHEFEGLSAALTAFHAAQLNVRKSPVRAVIARLLVAKALAATAGAVGIGGVALAAATGSLPAPAQDAAHSMLGAPAASSSSGPAKTHPTAAASPASSHPSATPEATATPNPSLVGLCRAYGVATANGKALANPAFTVLIAAAGGKSAVPGYCATLLAVTPGGRPTALPSQARGHKSAAHPTRAPAAHPTRAPAAHPTRAPATHPTSKPLQTRRGGR